MEQLPLFTTLRTWSVTDITRYIRLKFESDDQLQGIWVQGEVSNLSRPSSGHIYFTLKDSSAALKCVIWRSNAARIRLTLRDGAAVEVHGDLGVYEPAGQYQLYADHIRVAGEGQLFQEFLRLKEKLETEGLFDPERKRSIPPRPKKIGIITSPTGAALQDMLNTIRRRYPLAEVYFAPAAVQGEEAPAAIIQAFTILNSVVLPDVILVARGGGSLEDLWAFNDEDVVRAVAASIAPVISGVGHETDFTLTDFAADLRAPTPTAAAELATPNMDTLKSDLMDLSGSMEQLVIDRINDQRWQLRRLTQQLEICNPQTEIRSGRQRVDDLNRRCGQAVLYFLQLKRSNFSGLSSRMQAVSPYAVLNRGYALVTRTEDGKIISEKAGVHPGDALDIRVKDGHFEAQVTSD
jgi:exodeoxyribonuclease VII large subunit